MDIDLANLNKDQQAAVTHNGGPLLIVAGAGTGKTTVITQRINWLVREKKVKPEEILALTFTEKAAGEMEERVDRALPYGYVDLWISTFHSFAERILQSHALDIGLPHNFRLLDQTQSWLLVKKNIDKFNLDYYRPLGNPTKFIHALLSHFSRCKDEIVYPEDYLKYTEELKMNQDVMESTGGKSRQAAGAEDKEFLFQEVSRLNEIADAYHTYQQLLLDNNSLDFGDLINYTLRLFKKRKNILKKYQQQFKYILVDEFQDTNWAQYKLIKLLASPKNNLTVVGDDDQSIYKFRGASVSNIINFKKDYPRAKEILLTINYRSTQNILDLSYKFIQLNNPDRLEVKLTSAKRNFSKKLSAATQQTGIIAYNFFSSLDEEVDYIVSQIEKLKKDNLELGWNDFAILVRANDSANVFMNALRARQIPHQFYASRGLYLKPLILDILNYLRLLDNYRESTAMYRVLNMPVLKIKANQLINLNYWAKRKSWSLYETLKNISLVPKVEQETLIEVNKVLNWLEKHTAAAREKSVGQIIYDFLEDSGYLKHLKDLPSEIAKEQFNYLNQFYRKVRLFEESMPEAKVVDFLAEIELELAAGESGSLLWDVEIGPEVVNLMTIHAAKGLEFAYVFIPNLVDKRFPTISRSEPIELPEDLVKDILPSGDSHLQEERRLLYVAITRARQGVYFSGAADYGGLRKKKPSRFIAELGLVVSPVVNLEEVKLVVSRKEDQSVSEPFSFPSNFSYSQLKSFQSCPLQYKYAYLLRVPVKGKHTFSFGRSLHRTLQLFFELAKDKINAGQTNLFSPDSSAASQLPTEKDLLAIYQESWIDDWYENSAQKEKYFAKGRSALKDFYQQWREQQNIPEYLEKGFKLVIGDYTIRGVIDRIDRNEKGIEIIDYKTGQSKKKLDSQTKEQLLIYQLASQQAGEKVVRLTYYYLEDGSKISFLGTDQELEKLSETITRIISRIQASNFKPTPGPAVCRHCDFNRICEFSQAK